ncbi:MAG: M48 family metallopeptidase [Fibromonadaceae bacterium]|jgi:predicted metal-dependent hydrolase|nr:M48 family metallopeptidase [Fibromonadaceae bacterium]
MLLKKTFEIDGLKIETQRKRVKNVRLYVSPEALQVHLTIPFYASEKFALEFVNSKMGWLKKTLEKIKANPPVLQCLPEISKEEVEELRRLIAIMVPVWEFKLGVNAASWKLRKMKSRWGTCDIKTKAITFSTGLIKKPLRCIEYVVAHELAHLIVADHSAKFYAVIAKHFPYWKEIRCELNNVKGRT